MSTRFFPTVDWDTPLSFLATVAGDPPANALFVPDAWALEVYTPGVGWALPHAGEQVTSITCTDGARLRVCFNMLSGMYRMHTNHASVDQSANTLVFRRDALESTPLYLRIEGLDLDGSSVLPARYIDQDSLPGGLSQQVDQQSGITTSGSLSLDLVDIDNTLTAAFAPRAALESPTRLSADLSAEADTIWVENNAAFADSGFVFIDREAIAYSSKPTPLTLSGLTRGALDTAASDHAAKAAVFSRNPFLRGRHVRMQRPAGDTLSADDPVLFSGIIDSVQPASGNLADYHLSLSDALLALDHKPGKRFGHARLVNHLIVDGEATDAGRRGNDTLYLRSQAHPLLAWVEHTVRLAPGPYLSDAASLGHPRNIATALESAIDSVAPGLCGGCRISADGRFAITFNVDYRLQVLASGPVLSDCDSILATLGFDDGDSDILQNDKQDGISGNRANREWLGARSISGGAGAFNRRLYIESGDMFGGGASSFSDSGLVRIDDEIIYYQKADSGTGVYSAFLDGPITAEDTSIRLSDASGFDSTGGLARIGGEIIAYAGIRDGHVLIDCYRGAWHSVALAHSDQTTVETLSLACLSGCVRGAYGTRAAPHDGGANLTECLSSDVLTQQISGVLQSQARTPISFLLDLLDENRSGAQHALGIPAERINLDSFQTAEAEHAGFAQGGFRRLVFEDETYRDVVTDICRSLGLYLFLDRAGKLAIGRSRPQLAHQDGGPRIGQDNLIEAPGLQWCEDLRISRVRIDLDYDPIADTYNTRLIVDDDAAQTPSPGDDDDHTLIIQSKCLLSATDSYAETGALGACYDLAWRIIRQYNRFLTSATVNVLPDTLYSAEPFDSVTLDFPALPFGDGVRGGARPFDIVEIERDITKNRVRLGLLERPQGHYGGFAPVARVVAYFSNPPRAVIEKNAYWPDTLDPTNVFHAGDRLSIRSTVAQAAGLFSSEALTISEGGVDASTWDELSIATLTFTANPSVTPQPGDVLCSAGYGSHNNPDSALDRFVALADASATLDDASPAFTYAY